MNEMNEEEEMIKWDAIICMLPMSIGKEVRLEVSW